MRRILLWFIALACMASAAAAQNAPNIISPPTGRFYPTPGGDVVEGKVEECLNSSGQAVPISNGTCGAGNGGISVQPPVPASGIAGFIVIATTGTAVCLPSSPLQNGVVVDAQPQNAPQVGGSYTGKIGIGSGVDTSFSSTSTATGEPAPPGFRTSIAIANASSVCVNGTVGDKFGYIGN